MFRCFSIATAVVVCLCAAAPVSAQFGHGNSANNLFQQYVTPDGPNQTTAGIYPAPHPAPLLGGHSYYTYQPLMPHEMTYLHSRNYFNYYNSGGYFGGNDSLNLTRVRWQSGNAHLGQFPLSLGLEQFRYRLQSRFYCLGGNCDGGYGIARPRLIGGSGCASGNCGGGVIAAPTSGCATGGCTAKITDQPVQR